MINYDKPVRMKSGDAVKILTTHLMGGYPVLGNSVAGYALWERDGSCSPNGNSLKDSLENVPEEREAWLNIFPDSMRYHTSREEADAARSQDRIGRIKVTLRDVNGRFDE